MSSTTQLLSSAQAAERLGITVPTFYAWLAQSDIGEFKIRGESVTIDYLQGGRSGQGRIKVPEKEVQRLLDLMRVRPTRKRIVRAKPIKPGLKHITAKLGRPEL